MSIKFFSLACALMWLINGAAEASALARIISIDSNKGANVVEVTLKVEDGAFFNNSEVEYLSADGKISATLTLPKNIDMLMRGDQLGKVTLTAKRALKIPGFIADPNTYANFAAAQTAANTVAAPTPAASPVKPQKPVTASKAVPCPFTPAELKLALGIDFKTGKASPDSDFGTGKALSCNYESAADRHLALSVDQTVMNDPTQTQGWMERLAGTKEKIPNDSDGAIHQTDQGDLTSPNLHYLRSGDIVGLRVWGVGKKHPAFNSLQQKLPALRRLP